MSARETVLGRVRAALGDVPGSETPDDVRVERDYARGLGLDAAGLADLFAERVAEYRATVHRPGPGELAAALADACTRHGARRLVVPRGLPPGWQPGPGVELIADDGLDHAALDGADGALTGCAGAVALTGTVALDGGERSGRRALTLLPDLHLCVVEAGQVVGTIAELLERLGPERPLTLVSGPSATSDIELDRVEGVHGPRRLEVFLVSGAPAAPAPRSGR